MLGPSWNPIVKLPQYAEEGHSLKTAMQSPLKATWHMLCCPQTVMNPSQPGTDTAPKTSNSGSV